MSERKREGGDEADKQKNSNQGSNFTRRQLVASGAATWATVGLAGCNYITDPGPDTQDDGDNGADGGDETPTGNATVSNETTTTGNETTEDGSGGETTTESGGGSCSVGDEFLAGMNVAINVDIFDGVSGDHLGANDIDSVTVEFPDADFDQLELDWSGPHEEYRPDEWGGKLSTDEDTDSGTYRYEIVVEGEAFEGTERIADQFTIL